MNRRKFLKASSLTLIAATFGKLLNCSTAFAGLPPGKTACSDADPVAAALGYKSIAKEIDKTKYPQFKILKKNNNCQGCGLYKEIAASGGWGNCTMLADCVVSEKGLCGSWQKKS